MENLDTNYEVLLQYHQYLTDILYFNTNQQEIFGHEEAFIKVIVKADAKH
jgi:hypothetical protein